MQLYLLSLYWPHRKTKPRRYPSMHQLCVARQPTVPVDWLGYGKGSAADG